MHRMDWPEDTLEVMRLAFEPRIPLKPPAYAASYPATVPVLDPEGGTSLLTVVLPVQPRHWAAVYSPDPARQAFIALQACRMARRAARQAGLEPA